MSRRTISIRLQIDDADAQQTALADFLEAFTPGQRGKMLLTPIARHVRAMVAGLTGTAALGGTSPALGDDVADSEPAAPIRRPARRAPAVAKAARADRTAGLPSVRDAPAAPGEAQDLADAPASSPVPAPAAEPTTPPAVPPSQPPAPAVEPPAAQPAAAQQQKPARSAGLRALLSEAQVL